MVSCGDIPEEFLGDANFRAFVGWLAINIPNRADRKALGKCWSAFSKVPLTQEMWQDILNAGEPPVEL